MRLRTRLALAFLLMSVVPLTAITLYSYSSSRNAFRRAVEVEETAMAADMGRRMDMVTATVGDRVDRISNAAQAHDWTPQNRSAAAERFRREAVATLGDAAGFVSRLQFVAAQPPEPPVPPRGPMPPRRPGPPRSGGAPARAIPPPPPAAPAAAPAGAPSGTTDLQRLIVDLMPAGTSAPDIQKVLALGNLPTSVPHDLTAADAQAFTEGFAAAAKIAAKAIEERARQTEQQLAQARSQQRAQADQWMRQMRQGRGVDLAVHRDGQVVGTVNAQIDLDRVVASVLSSRRRESSEIAFAIGADGRLHTTTPDQAKALAGTGLLDRVRATKEPEQLVSNDAWIMATRRDPSGILFGITRPVGPALADIRRATGRNLGLGLLAVLVALVGIVPLSSRMTRPISVLHAGVKQIAQGNLTARVPVTSHDEIGHLAEAFNQMAQDLGAHEKLLAERERLRGELELCRQIQNEMLPKHPLRLGFAEVKGVSIPAREVGGDFFNYFVLPEGEIVLLVGDVSGKGVGAALLMANVQATLRARLALERDLAHLADVVDREVEENTPQSVYLTLFVGILDASHKVLRYVNAGHNPQFILRADGGLERLPSTGLPIGMFAGHGYEERSVGVEAGDVLFFFTDGTTEAENEAGEMFGTERLEALLVRHHEEGVDALLARLEQEVTAFRGRAELFDDATMMVLRLGAAVLTSETPVPQVPES
jgi:serine phosphatase RsbU (regulator of sigma subunit)